jgi:hypothetical protein
MSSKQKFYKKLLEDYIVIEDKEYFSSTGAKIIEIKKHFDNGNLLKHENGNVFGIVFFNVFSKKGSEEIISAIKNNFDNKEIDLLIEKNKLFQYMPESTIRYNKWRVGDIGNVTYVKNANNEFRIDFCNQTLVKRETKE